jgi:hypothetical protein
MRVTGIGKSIDLAEVADAGRGGNALKSNPSNSFVDLALEYREVGEGTHSPNSMSP